MGHPLSDNFSPTDYNGGTQNWRLDISDDGRVLVANNDGLLIFDGYKWDLHPLPNRTILRSVDYSQDTIFVGGQDEIGFFLEDSSGAMKYHSMWKLIPDSFDIADIWDIRRHESKLYFRTSRQVFSLRNNVFLPLPFSSFSEFLTVAEDVLSFNDKTEGIQLLSQSQQFTLKGSKEFTQFTIIDVLTHKDGVLVCTEGHGIFLLNGDGTLVRWKTNAQEYLFENKLNKALRLRGGGFAICTKYGGIVLLDESGQTRYRLDKSNGLQDNNVTDLIEDEANNLWVSTFYGVDRVRLGSGLYSFNADGDFQGAVYDVVLWRDKWWFATNNGLFTIPFEVYSDPFIDRTPSLFPGTEGQAWGLDLIDDKLYLAHHNGAFYIDGDARLIGLGIQEGAWKILRLKNGDLIIGCYTGVFMFKKGERIPKKIQGFSESSRIMMVDKTGSVWISHPYRGVFRMDLDDSGQATEIKRFSAESGYQCDLGNYVFSIDNSPVLANECGVFRYDHQNDRFLHDPLFHHLLDSSDNVRRIFEEEGGLWFISELETCFISTENGDSVKQKSCIAHIGKEYVGGFEYLFPVDERNVVVCTDRGVRLYHQDNTAKNIEPRVIISKFQINGGKRSFKGSEVDERLDLEPWEHDVAFEFRAVAFVRQDLQGFKYRMLGVSDDWTFSDLPFAGFSNLEPGHYEFVVKAITKDGRESEPVSIPFELKQWWYKTIWAKSALALVIIGIFFFNWLTQRKIYERDTSSLIKEKEKTENELEAVKAQRLRDELRFKNKELTSATLHLMQKQQTLSAVRTKVEDLEKKIEQPTIKKEIRRLHSLLNSNDRLEDDWEKFGHLFDQVHVDFLSRLKQIYPDLKPKDRKLCAFLRMNLTTKEIAPLLNISVRGVEISRYRLRKKLNLPTEVNLTEFILSI